jgi:tRNA(Arg) A34 adenosine deaminase TadA
MNQTAAEAWAGLSAPWQECFELAWQSFCGGGLAIGAALTDPAGQVLGRGRNQRFGTAGGGPLQGLLGHAEINALAEGLAPDKVRRRDAVLYTTLHPCPMCLGAIVVARVAAVNFAAFDPTWLGIERLPELNAEVRSRWPQMTGPMAGPLGTWAAVLPCLNTSGSLLRAVETESPGLAELARSLVVALRAPRRPTTAAEAVHDVWDLLTGAAGSEVRPG